jgi:hypothetical protein
MYITSLFSHLELGSQKVGCRVSQINIVDDWNNRAGKTGTIDAEMLSELPRIALYKKTEEGSARLSFKPPALATPSASGRRQASKANCPCCPGKVLLMKALPEGKKCLWIR